MGRERRYRSIRQQAAKTRPPSHKCANREAVVRRLFKYHTGTYSLGNRAMHLQYLTPLMTSISVTAILLVCRRSHHKVSADSDTFTVAPVVAYLMSGVGLLFCSVPFLPGVARGSSPQYVFWEFSPFWLLAFSASVFIFRYRVIVRAKTLIYGAFRQRITPFSEVID